jgi:selenocysteine lyase/cysteine desulfurase
MNEIPRRAALTTFASVFASAALAPRLRLEALELPATDGSPDDEAFWARVRRAFDLPKGVTNLDNGATSPAPRAVVDDLIRQMRYVEQLPARRLAELFRGTTMKVVAPRVAAVLGVSPEEIALVRNATEALDTVLLGVPLRAGDEVVCSAHDYFATLNALEQRRARDGVVLRMIHPPMPAASLADLAQLYEEEITPRTRLVLVTHVSNLTGQIYPVKRIAAAAHDVGAEVVVDAAQTLALLPHAVADLDCDYYGASLHKWLLAPVGSGVLWMRKPLTDKVWPLLPPGPGTVGMERFTWSGTYPEPLAAAITAAVDLHETIGGVRKAERLRYLTRYWRAKLEGLPRVRFYTTNAPDASCGLAVFEITGVDSEKLRDHLWDKHRIVVQTMQQKERAPEIHGVRVTPNVYTSRTELDRFVAAIERVVEHGL